MDETQRHNQSEVLAPPIMIAGRLRLATSVYSLFYVRNTARDLEYREVATVIHNKMLVYIVAGT